MAGQVHEYCVYTKCVQLAYRFKHDAFIPQIDRSCIRPAVTMISALLFVCVYSVILSQMWCLHCVCTGTRMFTIHYYV